MVVCVSWVRPSAWVRWASAAARVLRPGSDEARAASRVLLISSTYSGALCEEGTGSSG